MKYFIRKWHKFINEQKDSNNIVKIVLLQGEKILCLISDYEPYINEIDLPGGHIHYNEDPGEGLRREVREETCLIINNFDKLNFKHGNIMFFWGNMPETEKIQISDEHSAYYFLTLDEIMKSGNKISDKFLEAIKEALEIAKN